MSLRLNNTTTGSVTLDTPANGSDITLMIPSSVSASVATSDTAYMLRGSSPSNRNLLINGGFDVWQRGTSFTSITNVPQYSADRWFGFVGNTVTQAQIIRDASVPDGFLYSAKFGRPSSTTNANQQYICQCIESFNFIKARGQNVVLSFWARSGTNYSGGNLIVRLSTGTTQDQSSGTFSAGPATGYTGNVAIISTSSTSISSTWTRYTVVSSSPVPTNALSMGLAIGYTPSGTAGADDNIYITGVQLEVGNTATDFEFKSFGQELRECQRYFQRNIAASSEPYAYMGNGWTNTTTNAIILIPLVTTMRTGPASVSTSGNFQIERVDNNQNAISAISLSRSSQNMAAISATVSGATANQFCTFRPNNDANAWIGFSAEL